MANLMLHQGSSSVDREELGNVLTPPATHSWQPIAHEHLLHTTEQQLSRFNLHITGESHGLSRNGSRYFVLLEIGEPDSDRDYQTVIGVRNSHDKTFPAGICVGTCVMVCDNLCFIGADEQLVTDSGEKKEGPSNPNAKAATSTPAETDDPVVALEKLGAKISRNLDGEVVRVDLSLTQISDAGLVHIKGLTKLAGLGLGGTQKAVTCARNQWDALRCYCELPTATKHHFLR